MRLQQLLLGMALVSPAMLTATTLSCEPLSTDASANPAGTCIGHNTIIAQLIPARKLMMFSSSRPASRRGSVMGNQEGVQAASGRAKENSCWGLHTMMPLLLHGSQPPSAAGLSCSAARAHICTACFQLRFLKVHTGNSSCAPDSISHALQCGATTVGQSFHTRLWDFIRLAQTSEV